MPPPPRHSESDASAWGRGIRLPTIEAGVPVSAQIKFRGASSPTAGAGLAPPHQVQPLRDGLLLRDHLVVHRVLARRALARLQGVPDLVLLGHGQLDLVLHRDAERLDRRLTLPALHPALPELKARLARGRARVLAFAVVRHVVLLRRRGDSLRPGALRLHTRRWREVDTTHNKTQVGLWFYGVAEPLWHFVPEWPRSRWVDDEAHNDNYKAREALMVTYFHWGLHGWIPYATIGALLSIMAYRRGLPLTMRSCFYPLWGLAAASFLRRRVASTTSSSAPSTRRARGRRHSSNAGKGIEGWKGDIVDVLSIVCTIFGVCTSLGLGVRQINVGLLRLDKGRYAGKDVYGGVITTVPPPRKALCGDAPEQCTKGRLGIDYDVRTQCIIIAIVTGLATLSVLSGLKYGISLLSYVAFCMGMLLVTAVLFMGDTMYILDAIVSSFGYYIWYLPNIAWETDAWARLGVKHRWSSNGGATGSIVVDTEDFGPPDGRGASSEWMHSWTIFYWGWWISWGPFVGTFLARISKGRTLGEFIVGVLILPTLYCVFWFGVLGSEGIRMQMAADRDDVTCTNPFDPPAGHTHSTRMRTWSEAKHNQAYTANLYCFGTEEILFDQLGSYGSRQLSLALTAWSLVGLLFYFITSSDSGSFTVDMIAANGEPNPPKIQTVLWSFTEGLCAIALIKGGRGNPERSLKSLQAVSTIAGLPFTVVLMYMIHALWLAVKEEAGELDERRKNFVTTCLPTSLGEVCRDVPRLVEAALFPFLPIKRILTWTAAPAASCYATLAFITFYFAVTLLAMCPIEANLRFISAAWYMAFAAIVAYTRYRVRHHRGILHGDVLTDMCIAVLFYPLALVQHEKELRAPDDSYDGSLDKESEEKEA